MLKPFTLTFSQTSHNSIRVDMDFASEDRPRIIELKEFQLFQLVSTWGGYNLVSDHAYAWELPITLKQYLIDTFSSYCKMDLD